ncbi:MAG TPA: amino acid permease [Micropepsaceae bacterium]|jgi:APA family basic amino acid/polyamine antiporter|nr:amino acid permease [Micropepsaceae bacterium]
MSVEGEIVREEAHELHRTLGPWQLIALGIGAIIGAGIFVITGHAAAAYAGPGVVYSFMIAGLGCLFAGLCYAEFASMIPVAGSAYTYTYATMGKMLAWIIGWNLVLEYMAAASTVAVGWAGYFVELMGQFGIALPKAFSSAPIAMTSFEDMSLTGSVLNLPAMAIVALASTMLVIGIKASAQFNAVMVAIKLAIVVLVIAFGLPLIKTANLTPFVPPNTGTWGQFGWSGVFRATGVIFFAYIGFDAVSVAAQEARNPKRDIPIGILGSLVICTFLYILMSLTMTGLAPYASLNVPHPVYVAVDNAGPQLAWLRVVVNLGAVIGLASVVLVLLLGQSRVFYAMSRDGLIPPLYSTIHPKFRTPWIGTIVTGVIAALLAGIFPLGILGELVSIGTLLAFVIVCVAILVLRVKEPQLRRPFRTPFVWVVAPLGMGMCLFMMAFLPMDTWLRLLVWTIVGMIIFGFYGMRHGKEPDWVLIKQQPAE